MACYAPNKIHYKKAEMAFMRSYYGKIPNTDILLQINAMRDKPIKMSSLRHKLRRMRLITGIRLIHWDTKQIAFLLENYPTMGNIQLARELNSLKITRRKFTKKHVEKKMVLLDLKRTPEQLLTIKEGHKRLGHYPGRVHAEPEGTVVVRLINGLPHPHIKKGKFFEKQAREIWKDNFGPIPARHMVHFKDLNTMNLSVKNLILIKVGELTFADKLKMIRIAKENIERINRKPPVIIERKPVEIAKADQTIKVIINPKLTLYVKPGTDIEKLKQKYTPKPLTAFAEQSSSYQNQF